MIAYPTTTCGWEQLAIAIQTDAIRTSKMISGLALIVTGGVGSESQPVEVWR